MSDIGVKIIDLPPSTTIADTDLVLFGNPASGILYRITFGLFKTFLGGKIPLAFTSSPSNASVTVGGAASFVGVFIGGTPPYTCVWKLGTAALPGGTSTGTGTSSTYSVSNAQNANAGNYTLEVTDSLNVKITSNVALLVVNAPVGAGLSITTLANKSVNAGVAVTWSITASGGTPAYSYQWQKSNDANSWSNIAGATSASFTINNVGSGDVASYRLIVGDAAGASATSNAATLAVNTTSIRTANMAWFAANPFVNNTTAINVTGADSTTAQFNTGSNLSLQFPTAAQDKFLVVAIDSAEPTPLTYYHTTFINGTIGDQGFRAVFVVGSLQYIVSRAEFPLDNTLPLNLNH